MGPAANVSPTLPTSLVTCTSELGHVMVEDTDEGPAWGRVYF